MHRSSTWSRLRSFKVPTLYLDQLDETVVFIISELELKIYEPVLFVKPRL